MLDALQTTILFLEALLAWVPATMNAVAGNESRTAPAPEMATVHYVYGGSYKRMHDALAPSLFSTALPSPLCLVLTKLIGDDVEGQAWPC